MRIFNWQLAIGNWQLAIPNCQLAILRINLRHFAAMLILPGVFSGGLFAQGPANYQLDFNKDYISWFWAGEITAGFKTGSSSQFLFHDQFVSRLFQQSYQTDSWRDENTLGISWDNRLSSLFQSRTFLQSRIFSDESTSREFNKHLAAQEIGISVHPRIHLKPGLGLAFEKAFNNSDQGWYSQMGLVINHLDMGGYLNDTDLKSVVYGFPGRKNQEHTFFTGWTRQFSSYASDSLRVGYQFSESRYYIAPHSSLSDEPAPQEQVIINGRFVFNQLQYRFSGNSAFALVTAFRNRDIDQSNPYQENRRRKEISLENQIDYQLFFGPLRWHTGLFFSQTENNNDPGVRTDISTLQSAFNTRLQFLPSERDNFWGRFSYTKLEYNTPDVYENLADDPRLREDRDEQRFIIDAGYGRRFSEYFSLTLKGNVYLFHQIYLRSRRSQNNNWNRIYQLGAAFDHRISQAVRHRSEIRILANYTVFDFEELLPTVRSFVFRKLIYNDSLNIQLTGNLSLNTLYQWEKEDNGTFFKEDFTRRVNKELTAHYLNFFIQHGNVLGLTVTAGVSWFIRDEWSFPPQRERQKVREFRSITPRISLAYPAGQRLHLYATYAPNRATNFGVLEQYYTSGMINLRYNF